MAIPADGHCTSGAGPHDFSTADQLEHLQSKCPGLPHSSSVTEKVTLLWLTAGVFDGHGFNGRSAATYARKNIIRWLSVDTNATAKDPKKRLKAFEKVCSQISRGLARSELCGFDAQTSGLTTCFGLVQSNKACLASAGKLLTFYLCYQFTPVAALGNLSVWTCLLVFILACYAS